MDIVWEGDFIKLTKHFRSLVPPVKYNQIQIHSEKVESRRR